MEDENCVYDCFNYDENQGYFGVYDGHGGRMAVEFIKENLHNYVYQAMQTIPNTLEALKSAYLEADKHLCLQLKNTKNKKEEDAGCTASSVILKWEDNAHFMHCANIGDSRIVLNRGGKPERISVDHRADNEEEKKRVEKNKGFIINGKVASVLSVTRAFGDPSLKKMITAEPFTKSVKLEPTDSHVIIACDGLWDFVTETEAIEIISQFRTGQQMSDALLKKGSRKGIK